MVPGLTDRDDDLIELGKFVKTLKNVDKFEILPYHTMGVAWWEFRTELEVWKPPTKEQVPKDGDRKLQITRNGSKDKEKNSWQTQLFSN